MVDAEKHASEMLAELGRGDEEARALFTTCLLAGWNGRRVSTASRSLFVHRRTLSRRCKRAALPAPGLIVAWGRVLRSMEAYGQGGTLFRAARSAGITEQSAVSSMVRNRAGMWPSEWKKRGADMNVLRDAMVRVWKEKRGAPAKG